MEGFQGQDKDLTVINTCHIRFGLEEGKRSENVRRPEGPSDVRSIQFSISIPRTWAITLLQGCSFL